MITLFSLPADFFSSFTYGPDKLRGMAFGGTTPRKVIFIENTLSTDHPNYVCNVVLHELAHLYDLPRSPATSRQSDGENFVTAFKQDIADTLAKREMHELIDKNKHYRSHQKEAFAEAVSRTILLHPKMKGYQNYAALFPNVMSYVRKLLIDDGIIRPDHKGDAQIVREFERKRR